MTPDSPCPHPEFHSDVAIKVGGGKEIIGPGGAMVWMPRVFVARVTIRCVRCGVLFEHVGVPAGDPTPAGPTTDASGTTMTVYVRPTLEQKEEGPSQ